MTNPESIRAMMKHPGALNIPGFQSKGLQFRMTLLEEIKFLCYAIPVSSFFLLGEEYVQCSKFWIFIWYK
ncbi:MAG: hypothetical protein ACFFER_17985, partial [Candidatus Thorarchaeota archaeon]